LALAPSADPGVRLERNCHQPIYARKEHGIEGMTTQKTNTPIAFQARNQRRLGSRAALLAGFGALLVLMVIICVDALHTLAAFETNDTRIRQDFIYRERTLEQVRAGLYESGTIMRDYLLLSGSERQAQETLLAQLQSIRNETTAALKACIESLPPEKRKTFEHLAAELENYWSKAGATLVPGERETKLGNSVLRADILSQHAEILKITKEVSAVNDAELKEAEGSIAEISSRFRLRLLMVTTIALSIGLVLATATIIYAGRLEKSLEEKYRESLQAQGQLKDLSKRLVDAEERERRAISRELHDEVGQSLSAMLLEVESLTEMSNDKEGFRKGLQNIRMLAENCVNEVRNMALLLRPSMLDDLGLIAALEWQAREVSRRTGMLVETADENVSDALPDEHKTCVYRIVQEALNNCSRHAYAKNVRVVVRQEPKHLRVSIDDDGKGFDPSRVRGLGLVGMNERVSQLGGVLKVDSDPLRGTRLLVELPLSNSLSDVEN
jgi:signal transduction histidine kinase